MSFRCPVCEPLTEAERRPYGLPYGVSLGLCARHAPPAPPPRRLVPRPPRAAVRERIARHLGADPADLADGTPDA